jgi:hypothetical protein
LVYPEAMRQILWYVYKIEKVTDADDMKDWRCQWLSFAAALPGVGGNPGNSGGDEDWENWISRAVAAFCQKHRMADCFATEFRTTKETVA